MHTQKNKHAANIWSQLESNMCLSILNLCLPRPVKSWHPDGAPRNPLLWCPVIPFPVSLGGQRLAVAVLCPRALCLIFMSASREMALNNPNQKKMKSCSIISFPLTVFYSWKEENDGRSARKTQENYKLAMSSLGPPTGNPNSNNTIRSRPHSFGCSYFP